MRRDEPAALMKQAIRDNLVFIGQFRRRFHTTGALLPSGRFLARAITRYVRTLPSPKRILEVGPGTGAVTREIVPFIGPEDHFDLVEINEQFAELLRERFRTDPRFRPAAAVSQIHVCPMQEFRSNGPYDAIISGLPFNNFSPQLVAELMDLCLGMLAPGGTFSFYEYMYVRRMKWSVAHGAERTRLRGVHTVLEQRLKRYCFHRDWIFANVPPAWVRHLRLDAAPASGNGDQRPRPASQTAPSG